jgi:hypothetical protein
LQNLQPEDPDPPIDPVAALSNIQDDESARREAVLWAGELLIVGQAAEDLVSELIAEGWSTDEADEIVEEARKSTRRQRGVITRDDVVRDLNVSYRRQTAGLSVAFRSGLFGLFAYIRGLMDAIRSLRKLMQRKR